MFEPIIKENGYFVKIPVNKKRKNGKKIELKILKQIEKSSAGSGNHTVYPVVFTGKDGIPFGFSCCCGKCHFIIDGLPLWSISISRETMLAIKSGTLGFELIDGKISYFKIN